MQAPVPALTDEMVRLDGVGKSFGAVAAVREVSFALKRGEFLTIVGPSGCGKTTLLRMIAGFERPDTGRIAIGGQDMARRPPHRRSIGMVFQRLALFPHMTAAENVAYPLKRRGFAKGEIAQRVRDTLALVRLDGLGERRPHALSGGQQQRVAIARALSYGPDLLLLDEPLSALDKSLREDMQLEFRRIQQDLGVTTINVTHDQREALVMSDRMVVMSEGCVEQADAPEAVYHAPRSRFVAAFLGTTATFSAAVTAVGEGRVRLDAGGEPLVGRSPGSLAVGDPVTCAVRAERVQLEPPDPERAGEADGENRLAARVEQRIFEGDRMVYVVNVPALGGVALSAFDRDPLAGRHHAIGAEVTLRFAPEDLFAFPDDPKNQN